MPNRRVVLSALACIGHFQARIIHPTHLDLAPEESSGADMPTSFAVATNLHIQQDRTIRQDLPIESWEERFADFVTGNDSADAAHDIEHIRRVVLQTRLIGEAEGADPRITLPAAWLHDCVSIAKNSPDRSRASLMAAERAAEYLREVGYAEEFIPAIHHAIHAHSFSAGVPTETIEAEVVQDADRLDALGAIGIARTLMLGATMGQRLYDPAEPVPLEREPDDRTSALDHFYVKLFTLADTMKTATGRAKAQQRTEFMQQFVDQLLIEIDPRPQTDRSDPR